MTHAATSLPAAAGRLIVGHKVEVGYLEQTAVSGSENSVWQEARSRMTDLVAAEEAMEAASQAALDGGWHIVPAWCGVLGVEAG